MAVSLMFYKSYTDGTTNTPSPNQDLSEAKVVVYEDGGGNKYILDASNITGLSNIDDIKLSTLKGVAFKYQPSGSTNPPVSVEGLGSIMGALLGVTETGNKSVLVEKLGGFLDTTDTVYDANKTAKEFLGEKGMKGPKGDQGANGIQGERGEKGETGQAGASGAQGERGEKGETGQAGAPGAQGERGEKGETGQAGAAGANGAPADVSLVAAELLSETKKGALGEAVLGVQKSIGGADKPALVADLAGTKALQDAVSNTLKGNSDFRTAVKASTTVEALKSDTVFQKAVAGNADLQTAVAGNADLQTAVTNVLKIYAPFQKAVGAHTTAAALKSDVDFQKAVAGNADLQTAVAGQTALQTAVAGTKVLQDAVTNVLKIDAPFQTAVGLHTTVAALKEDGALQKAVAEEMHISYDPNDTIQDSWMNWL